mmetsp:Transcript_34100/g.47262  ORF Transcript_34100/g.47262 Transcript_34100/m.47262 type:complete len:194 (+) Transcript_34100:196-777(+)|eukprot:CAMPEP_0196583884 /NCGR_PEP_ID=MMETSP1081-20130531/45088_1 /TAXON_ID=36882 /ORGANISM="Pyramimonas amylifera, Strain CCMP720" /LENGTH=193 /DNA_ID=CAMNT_0041904919 /DNA_START=195 /DNA_END=776 /DNA_ORIENTATION=+
MIWSDSGLTKPLHVGDSGSTQLGPAYEANQQCHAHVHSGYDGHAFTWGMSFRTETAGECCAACEAHQSSCSPSVQKFQSPLMEKPQSCGNGAGVPESFVCNVWVFCPLPMCWAQDIWNHTFGECWLKNQQDPAHPIAPNSGAYPAKLRAEHTTAPEKVEWISGVIVPEGTEVLPNDPHWGAAENNKNGRKLLH